MDRGCGELTLIRLPYGLVAEAVVAVRLDYYWVLVRYWPALRLLTPAYAGPTNFVHARDKGTVWTTTESLRVTMLRAPGSLFIKTPLVEPRNEACG